MLKPRTEYVLLAELESSEVTAGGVFIPEQAREKTHRGFVIEVGTNVEDITVGDTVIYSQYAGTNISWEGEDFILLKEQDIFAKVVE